MTDVPVQLNPQIFSSEVVTQIPAKDLFEIAKNSLPFVYQGMKNFMSMLQGISTQKQYLYDVMRSLINCYDLIDSHPSDSIDARPSGVYLRMVASDFNISFNDSDDDNKILTLIIQKINFVVSRGRPFDFYSYFAQNNLDGFFDNVSVQETGNATVFFNVPIPNLPLVSPNPFEVFTKNMNKIKAAGIKINTESAINIPYFQLASLSGEVAPGNAGFAGLNLFGQAQGGGFYISV